MVGWNGSGVCVGCQVSCGMHSVYVGCVSVVKVWCVCSEYGLSLCVQYNMFYVCDAWVYIWYELW